MADKVTPPEKQANGQLEIYNGSPLPLEIPTSWLAGTADGQFLTSLNKSDPAARKQILTAIDGEPDTMADCINVKIEIHGMTLQPISFPDEDSGEIVNAVKLILHCANGKMYKCVSKGALRSALLICGLFGPPPWPKPISVIPRRLPTSGGRSRYMLELQE